MKKKLKAELRGKSITELTVEALKSRQVITRRRMEIQTGKSKNTNLCRLSDDYAVISTILKQKEEKEKKK